MEILGAAAPSLESSDNVMLVVSDGKDITFLSEVLDGVAWGSPTLSSGCAFGVAPRLAETETFANTAGLDDGSSLQRLTDTDTDNSAQDFHVLSRSPGKLNNLSTVATPTFNPDGGIYSGGSVNVTVSCATAGATIRYTTNGSDPTESSPVVASGGTVPVSLPGILKAKAWKTGMNPSAVKSAAYTRVVPAAGDFDGDGFADPAVVDTEGNWYVWFSSAGYARNGPYVSGVSGTPAAGDFDGDGFADPVVVRGTTWHVWLSTAGYQESRHDLGVSGTPVLADFDGDGLADPVVVNAAGNWYVWFSSAGYARSGPYTSDVAGAPAAGAFDGDGFADPVVVDAAGNWYVWFSAAGYVMDGPYDLGIRGAPLATDFDGDGLADPVVVDAAGNWYVWFSSAGYARSVPYPLTPWLEQENW
ncbi:MAG: chitobiase/beta-hexosaminidase C-terminal domain-containing protein [Lentisphaerae bacterium]|nr:chitobiase/beta-hexosaminidase C-terminal domain-containing protein [Lentisphaerota bacterium]